MQWSQLKHQLKRRIATGLADNIELNQTRYRHSHDQEGEFWITYGKERIFSCGSLSFLSTLGKMRAEYCRDGADPRQASADAWAVMEASGVLMLDQVNRDLFGSLSQTVDDMLRSTNPVVRALALIDARYGKRRLAAFDPADEHPLVQRLFHMRCEAEGIHREGIHRSPPGQ